jgi:hypothetical protein
LNLGPVNFFALSILFTSSAVFSQPVLTEVDSLPIVKVGQVRRIYNVDKQSLETITIKDKKPVDTSLTPKRHIGGGFLTLLTGIETGSSDVTTWRWPNELQSSDQSRSWQVPIFFTGEFSKSSQRVKDDDGSFSVNIQKGIQITWPSGVVGAIIKGGDTLGVFEIVQFPTDSISKYWLSRIEIERREVTKILYSYQFGTSHQDFSVRGIFNNKAFMMITGGRQYRSVILVEDKPIAIVQSHPVDFVIIKKKHRIHPYVLLSRNTMVSKDDIVMLGFLNMMLAKCAGTNYLEL